MGDGVGCLISIPCARQHGSPKGALFIHGRLQVVVREWDGLVQSAACMMASRDTPLANARDVLAALVEWLLTFSNSGLARKITSLIQRLRVWADAVFPALTPFPNVTSNPSSCLMRCTLCRYTRNALTGSRSLSASNRVINVACNMCPGLHCFFRNLGVSLTPMSLFAKCRY